jgi:hypothetical protein
MFLLLLLLPSLNVADISPALIFPYPRMAGPEFQLSSLNPTSFQAVSWFDPSSRYFHTEPFGIRICPTTEFTPAVNRTIQIDTSISFSWNPQGDRVWVIKI